MTSGWSGNDIRVVDTDTFSVARFWDEREDRRLAMTSCNLGHVTPAAFSSLPTLRSLRLADNPRLPRDDLLAAIRRVDTLRKLDVSSSLMFRRTFDLAELFYLDSAAGLRLEELMVAGNGIRTVSMNMSTAGMVGTLRSLDLAYNELTTLDGGLSLLRRLERLSVRRNRLTRIDRDAVIGLDWLMTLDVSYNELEKLDDGALRSLTRLRRLNLAGNRLRTLSPTAVPPRLEVLSVRDNHLVSVVFLTSLAHLRSVDVSGNGLICLDAHLFSQYIRSPVSANFSHNEISSIDGQAFVGVAFSVLDLTGNRLTRLSLYGADAVNVLRADDNLICDVDDEVFHATRDLHLANNWLRSLRTLCDSDSQFGSSSSPIEVSSPKSLDNTHVNLVENDVCTSSTSERTRLDGQLAEVSSPEIATQSGTTAQRSSPRVLVLDISGNPNLGPSLDSQHRNCYSLVDLCSPLSSSSRSSLPQTSSFPTYF